MTKWGLFQGCKDGSKFENQSLVIHQKLMQEKSIWQKPKQIYYKNSQKTEKKENFLNLIKNIYKKPTVNLILVANMVK